jgi:tetratricopeptide (TPR) repeat protein
VTTSHRRSPGWRGLVCRQLSVALAILAVVPVVWAATEEAAPNAFRELQLGYLALDQGDFETAMTHYARARDLASGEEQRFNALFGLGSAALELGRLDEARAALGDAHELRPGDAGATFMLGVACRRQGDLDAAVTYLADAAVRDPDLTQALVELGIAYAAQERHADAERICRTALARDPDNLEAQIGLAVALFHQDENEAAAAAFRRALELDPDDLRAHYGLGLALAFSGDRDGAIEEIIYLNSRSPELANDLHRWVYQDGN